MDANFRPQQGTLTYTTLGSFVGNAEREWLTMYFSGGTLGDDAMDRQNVGDLKDEDLNHLRNQLVRVLTLAENEMDRRGFFKRYTTKDQD